MPAPILATKLYIPAPRPGIVPRPRLIERLNVGLDKGCKLTLISASAGFGKTTLVSEWIKDCGRPVAWISLDEGDGDPVRFLTYLIAALQTVQAGLGEGVLSTLQSQIEMALTTLLNEISAIADPFLLNLDDYHTIDSKPWMKPSPFWSSACRRRCTWSSPCVKTDPCRWRDYASAAS